MAEPKDSCILHNEQGSDAEVGSSEIGQNGAWEGASTYVACKFDDGSYSNNLNNRIKFAGDNFDPNKFIIEYWFIPDGWNCVNGVSSAGGATGWISWYIDDNNRVSILHTGGGLNVQVVILGVTRTYTLTTGVNWVDGTRHHIFFVYDKDGIDGGADITRIYLDDSLADSTAGATANQPQAGANGDLYDLTFYFGGAGNFPFKGTHDNIKIYDGSSTALSTAISANKDNEGFLPDVPTNIQATDGTIETHVEVSWDAADGADDYNVFRADALAGSYTELSGWQVGVSYKDGTAVPGVTYWYKVKSRNGSGESALSSADSGWRGVTVDDATYPINRAKVLILDNEIDVYELGYVNKLQKISEQKTYRRDKLIMNQITQQVKNYDDAFSVDNNDSFFKGQKWRFKPFKIINIDGDTIWDGIIQDVERDHKTKIAKIKSVDKLYEFHKKKIAYISSTWETPGDAFKNLCDQEEFTGYNAKAVQDSINQYTKESCFIMCNFGLDDDITFQQTIEKLGEIGCADVYTHMNQIYFQHWTPFTGSVTIELVESDLLQPPKIKSTIKDLTNEYRIGYDGDEDDPATDADNNNIGLISRTTYGEFSLREMNTSAGEEIVFKDLTSAVYIGECYIKRPHKKLETQPDVLWTVEIEVRSDFREFLDLTTFVNLTFSDEDWDSKTFEVFGMTNDYDNNRIKLLLLEVDV